MNVHLIHVMLRSENDSRGKCYHADAVKIAWFCAAIHLKKKNLCI
jgi:hypothetical protein